MTKRRVVWAVGATVLLLGLAGVLLWLTAPADMVTHENYQRAVGKSLAEVEEIFGRPADGTAPANFDAPGFPYRGPFTLYYWSGRDTEVHFVFDADSRMAHNDFAALTSTAWYEQIANWLGL
jgi:hypothetical protein